MKLFIIIYLFCNQLFSFENFVESISEIPGVKYPNDGIGEPVLTYALTKRTPYQGFNALLPFIMPSPNQEDAGSCLYMAITGNIEWWLNKLNPQEERKMDGPHDLSERYLMNVAGMEEENSPVKNWRTDTVFLINSYSSVLNIDYPYTKGWYKDIEGDKRVKANAEEKDAWFGTGYNWINEIESLNPEKINLPKFDRGIIFADPSNNQWNTGISPKDIVDQVKEALVKNQAPVMVIYNHYGYWHAHMIVGFDDQEDTNGCKFTLETAPYLKRQAEKFYAEADEESDLEIKEKLKNKAAKYINYASAIERTMNEIHCSKGAFFVRDSLYSDSSEGNYTYHTLPGNDDKYYVKKVILREYEYLRALANHVIQIRPMDLSRSL